MSAAPHIVLALIRTYAEAESGGRPRVVKTVCTWSDRHMFVRTDNGGQNKGLISETMRLLRADCKSGGAWWAGVHQVTSHGG